MPANLENSAVAQNWKRSVFISIPKKVKVKSLSRVQLLATPWTATHQAPPSIECSKYHTHLTRQQSNAQNSPSKASTVHELRNSRGSSWIQKRQRNQRSNCQHPLGHRKSKRVPKNFCFTDYAKAFDCVDHNKLWKILKEMGIPDHLTCLLRNQKLYV